MRLVELEVHNIRSYRHARTRFHNGITLLAGDIGAGKSTLLAAIEFALFGIARGELSGAGLLRHGATDGDVRLSFVIDGTAYEISRTLHRSRTGVTQDTGWLSTNGRREQFTPSELRARIFQLLGYPLHFLAKQRNLVYRSTVYTPQEEMKAILAQSSEERIETIRRLFGLDAYRTARENAQLLARALRDRESATQELLAHSRTELSSANTRLASAQDLIMQRETLLLERTNAVTQRAVADESLRAAQDARSTAMAVRSTIAMQTRARASLLDEITRTTQLLDAKHRTLAQHTAALAIAQERADEATTQTVTEEELLARMSAARTSIETARSDEGKLTHIIQECQHDLTLDAGTPCPTCQQIVSAEHLTAVRTALDAKGMAANKRLTRVHALIAQAQAQFAAATQALEHLRTSRELRERLTTLTQFTQTAQLDVQTLDERLTQARIALAALPPAQDELTATEQLRRIEDTLILAQRATRAAEERTLEIERSLARLDAQETALVEVRERAVALENEIAALDTRVARNSAIQSWLVQQFIPLTESIERRVLANVHTIFDRAFTTACARLLEDDALVARLDGTFGVIVTQHGYETDITHLSGGERTAVALAYRLALVRAVHALLPHLGTAGLVILDEPTDGFSREQLARVAQVLRTFGLAQLIIVSHDPLLEGFVDHVLRIQRDGDGSVVADSLTVAESL